jgi:hypothetical protein
MNPPGGYQDGPGERYGQQPHREVRLIAMQKETDGWGKTRRDEKRQERFRPGRQQGRGAEHHSSKDENQKDLVRPVGLRVEQDSRRAPTGPRQTGSARKRGAPPSDLMASR